MPTKKPTTKAKSVTPGFRTISWLRFLPNISQKQTIVGLVAIIILICGLFFTIRAINSLPGINCYDWNITTNSKISIKSMTIDRPADWQKHYCYQDNESNSQAFTLHDYMVPDIAALAYAFGLSDGWGVFVPSNSGRIEILQGDWIKNEGLTETEKRYHEWNNAGQYKIETSRFKVAGYDALQIIMTDEPKESLKSKPTGRFSYSRAIIIDKDGFGYSLKLWNSWHKPESRDAWVAKYNPVFDEIIQSIEFK